MVFRFSVFIAICDFLLYQQKISIVQFKFTTSILESLSGEKSEVCDANSSTFLLPFLTDVSIHEKDELSHVDNGVRCIVTEFPFSFSVCVINDANDENDETHNLFIICDNNDKQLRSISQV